MWKEHDEIRDLKLHNLIENYESMDFGDFKKELGETATSLSSLLSSHIFKENNILFPTALRLVTEQNGLKPWRTSMRLDIAVSRLHI